MISEGLLQWTNDDLVELAIDRYELSLRLDFEVVSPSGLPECEVNVHSLVFSGSSASCSRRVLTFFGSPLNSFRMSLSPVRT